MPPAPPYRLFYPHEKSLRPAPALEQAGFSYKVHPVGSDRHHLLQSGGGSAGSQLRSAQLSLNPPPPEASLPGALPYLGRRRASWRHRHGRPPPGSSGLSTERAWASPSAPWENTCPHAASREATGRALGRLREGTCAVTCERLLGRELWTKDKDTAPAPGQTSVGRTAMTLRGSNTSGVQAQGATPRGPSSGDSGTGSRGRDGARHTERKDTEGNERKNGWKVGGLGRTALRLGTQALTQALVWSGRTVGQPLPPRRDTWHEVL